MEKFKQHEVRSYDGYLVDKKIALVELAYFRFIEAS